MHPVSARLVFSTCPDANTASLLARTLVAERLAACVNVVGGVVSTYRWQESVQVDDEVLLVIKTTADRLDALQARLLALHRYDVPEFIAIEPDAVEPRYAAWLAEATAAP
jgi:periplasmic divalent cation tolerance protein